MEIFTYGMSRSRSRAGFTDAASLCTIKISSVAMNLRVVALIGSLAIELFSINVFFFYIPLLAVFGKDDQFTAALYRAVEFVAPVLLGFVIGSIVDRSNKRALGVSISMSVAVLTFYLATRIRNYSELEMLGILALISVAMYFLANLRITVMPIIVERANLHRANAALLIVDQVGMLASPIFAAALIHFDAAELGLSLVGLAFLFSSFIYFLAFNRMPEVPPSENHIGFRTAVALLVGHRKMFLVTLASMGMNCFVSIFPLYAVIFAVEAHILSETTAPSLLAVSAIAGIVAGLLQPRLFAKTDTLKLAALCCIGLAIAGTIVVAWPSVATFYLLAFCDGTLTTFFVISAWTLRQTSFDASVLGKVTGVTFILLRGAMLISPLLAGLVAHRFGGGAALLVGSYLALIGFMPAMLAGLQQKPGQN
jgi:Major Facilitator Superfamily